MKLSLRLKWIIDYHFVYFLYSPMKRHKYHAYMFNKWGEKYCTEEEYKKYIDTL